MKTKLFTLFFVLLASIGTMFASVMIGDICYNFNQTLLTAEVASLPSGLNNSTYKSYEQVKTRNIPSTITYNGTTYDVTSIGDKAFIGCSGMTSITIPNSITSIGDYAFRGCSGLTSIEIPNSVTSIGESAFSLCTGFPVIDNIRYADTYLIEAADKTLSSYTINEDTKWMANNAFSGCNNLTSIIIPNNVKNIGAYAFSQCTNLSTITIGENVTNIENFAFNGCVGLSSIVIADGVQNIERCAFYGCSGLTHVTIGKGVTNIEDKYYDSYYKEYRYVFSGCNNISSVVWNAKNCNVYYFGTQVNTFEFGNEVEVIPASICKGMTQLTSMTIPNSVTSIGDNAFSGCSGLTSITLGNSVTSIGDGAFSGCTSLNSPIYNAHIYVFMPASYSGAYSIPDGIKSIYGNAFAGCINLTSIIIPNSVTDIGGGAFYGCTGLTSIEIPNSVTSIGNSAFSVCTGVTSLTLGDSVTSIGDKAFNCCTGLTSVTIPNSVTSIERRAFTGCDNLKTITLNSEAAINVQGSTEYNHGAIVIYGACQIFGSQVENIIIGDDVTNIGAMALSSFSNLQSITIGKSVTGIAGSAFSGCSNITSVVWNAKNSNGYNFGSQVNSFIFGNEVEIIPASICSGMTQLTSMTIPNSVTSIGDNAFSGCTGLTAITIPNNITNIGSSAFSGCSGLKTATLGDSVSSIGDNAFGGCSGLTSITIPETVTSIGAGAFSGCTGLKTATIGNSVSSIGDNAFGGCSGLTSITIPETVTSIGAGAFSGCTRLTSVTLNLNTMLMKTYKSSSQIKNLFGNQVERYYISIGTDVVSLADNFFKDLSSLVSITIPETVTSIGAGAFSGCTGLKTATIGNSVSSIGDNAFGGCSGLTSITIPKNMKSIGSDAFYGCSNLTTVIWNAKNCNGYNLGGQVESFTLGDEVEVIPANLCSKMSRLTSIIIPSSVISIGNAAFSECYGLTSVIIPSSVTSIGDYAFWHCSSLISVTIPNSVTSIGRGAFSVCAINEIHYIGTMQEWNEKSWSPADMSSSYDLYVQGAKVTDLVIPNSFANIGNYAFSGCSSLTSVEIPNSITSIRRGAFRNCTALTSVTIPNSVTDIGGGAFYGCTGLTSIEIPNSVTDIGGDAFYGCTGLTSIEIPNSVTSIGNWAFRDCTGLTSVTCAIDTPLQLSTQYDSNKGKWKGVFDGVKCPLYVPYESVDLYKVADQWKEFSPIVAIGTILHRVDFMDWNGTILKTQYVEDGTSAISPGNPSREGYAFVGWDTDFNNVTSDLTITAQYCRLYTITFVNWNGEDVLKQIDVNEGSVPQYTGAIPTRPGDSLYVYTFAGWTPEIVVATEDATYIATYTSSTRLYTITWQQDDGTLIDETLLEYGKMPTHANPTKAATAEFSYTFAGWTPEVVAVTGDTTYTATYSATRRSYTITWQNEDGSLIDQTTVEYGVVPTHADPVKPNTAEYTYTFAGWTPAVVAVTGDATYRATFKATKNSYTITWLNDDGSLIDKTTVEYGKKPTHTDPVKTTTDEFVYTFTGWTPEIVVVTGDATYTATYSAKHRYTVVVTAVNGTATGGGKYVEGTQITIEATPDYGYHFVRWSDGNADNPRTIIVTENLELTAEFAIDKSGVCGKENALRWTYEDNSQTLTISGRGELTANYTFGVEAPSQMKVLVIGNEVTAIGARAFYGVNTIHHLTIGGGVTTIGDYAFAECKNFDDITCNAQDVPTISATTFNNIGNKLYIYLFVPENRVRAYKRDSYWGEFDVQGLGAETTETDDVRVTSTATTASVAWPAVSDAATYELVIRDKSGNVICTLIFNSAGQLTSIAFMPSRGDAPQKTQTAGFSFTVTGLEAGTSYDLTITAKSESGQELDKKNVSFHTESAEGIEDIHVDTDKPVKVLMDNHIYILRGDKTYTLTGAEVK